MKNPATEISDAISKLITLTSALPEDWGDRAWQSEECSDTDNFDNCRCIVSQGVHSDDPFSPSQLPPVQYIADTELVVFADYIVTMQPLVAKAILTWLMTWHGIALKEDASMPKDARHALAVARAINLKNG